MSGRLCEAALAGLPATVGRPRYARAAVEPGIVHLGPGAFHRVHEAWYADRWLASDPRWGLCEVSMRSTALRDALAEQDGLYTLAVLDERQSFEVVGAIREMIVAQDGVRGTAAVIARPTTRLVTLTVTEKGYCLAGDGHLDFAHPDIAHDLARPDAPRSAIGFVTDGLRRRREAGLGGVPVLSCDNLAGNGHRLGAAVRDFSRALDPGLAAWIEAEVPFPCSMVDSITPATTDALRERVARELGVLDRWPVQREAFVQWVVEEHPAAESPDWSGAGVALTGDVTGWERAKLRLLNGAHSTLAYVGLLRGHVTVEEAMHDAALSRFARDLMLEDVAPTVGQVRGLDVPRYVESVLGRFRNPAIRHELAQIAWDGSKKLPVRLLGTVADLLAGGASVSRPCVTLAAWMHFVRRRTEQGIELVDPLAAQLARIARERCNGEAAHDVAEFLALHEVFPPALAGDGRFRVELERAYARLAASPDALLT